MSKEFREYSASGQFAIVPESEASITGEDVVVFQKQAIGLFGGSKEAKQLGDASLAWGGFGGNGSRFSEFSPAAQGTIIEAMGPSVLKAMRFTSNIPDLLDKARSREIDLITLGGSCLVTSADNKARKKGKIDMHAGFLDDLPNLMQAIDSTLPIRAATATGNIVEDTIFHTRLEGWSGDITLPQVQAVGQRATDVLSLYGHLHGAPSQFFSVPFSETSAERRAHELVDSLEFQSCIIQALTQYPYGLSQESATKAFKTMGKTVFLFSYSGPWAQDVRTLAMKKGIVTGDKPIAVVSVEPYQHYLEIAGYDIPSQVGSIPHLLETTFGLYYRDYPFGKDGSKNGTLDGAIGFIPWLTYGGIGHRSEETAVLPSLGNQGVPWVERARSVLTKDDDPHEPFASLDQDVLLHAGVNWLYYDLEARRATNEIFAVHGDLAFFAKDKAQRKAMRKDPAMKAPIIEAHGVLYDQAVASLDSLGYAGKESL